MKHVLEFRRSLLVNLCGVEVLEEMIGWLREARFGGFGLLWICGGREVGM